MNGLYRELSFFGMSHGLGVTAPAPHDDQPVRPVLLIEKIVLLMLWLGGQFAACGGAKRKGHKAKRTSRRAESFRATRCLTDAFL